MVKQPNILLCKRGEKDSITCMHESVTELEGGEVECNECKKLFQVVDINPDLVIKEIEDLDELMDGIKYRLPLIGKKKVENARLHIAIQKFSRWLSIMKKEFPELCITVQTMIDSNKEDEDGSR